MPYSDGRGGSQTPGWRTLAVLFAAAESAMIWWRIEFVPFAWICLVWTSLLLVLFRFAAKQSARFGWINLAAAVAAGGLCEGGLAYTKAQNPYRLPDGVAQMGDFAKPGYFVEVPVEGLGYRPRPGTSASSARLFQGQYIYNVRYTVDALGMRVAAPEGDATQACILMFGDSVAWGEGLNDAETAAYQLGQLAAGKVKIRNFAFTGYGAHQMLWQVQSGDVRRKADCARNGPVTAIYQALPNNISRVAGMTGWDNYGPRYVMDQSGRIAYRGSFSAGQYVLQDRLFIPEPWASQLSRINLYARILGRDRHPRDFDRARYAAILRDARAGLSEIFPRIRFIVIIWPDLSENFAAEDSQTALLITALRKQRLETSAIGEFVGDYNARPLDYAIPRDGHPNASANGELAKALLPMVTGRTVGNAPRPADRPDR